MEKTLHLQGICLISLKHGCRGRVDSKNWRSASNNCHRRLRSLSFRTIILCIQEVRLLSSLKPLLCLLVISFFASSAYATGGGSDYRLSKASVPDQTTDSALFAQSVQDQPASSDLFFLKTRPRLDLSTPAKRPRSAVLNDTDCYTMRMYKVKRKERFDEGESFTRGYTTCELASNYQIRTAIVHVQTTEGNDLQSDTPQK
jgi:hypothetical protein